MIQTAEGALTEINNMVNRVRELTVQAANDTNTGADREKMAAEVTELMNEIDATSTRAEFNQQKILAGKVNAGQVANLEATFQIGANTGQKLALTFDIMNVTKLGFDPAAAGVLQAFGITAKANAGGWTPPAADALKNAAATAYSDALTGIDTALGRVASLRARYGANQNRLEYTINNLNLSSENLNSARSRIEDADMAKEMMNLTSANVLQQAATSMLAQANQAPNNITQLLG